jgi:hypothetical protein
MAGLPEDLNELPADIQNYMRKLAEMDIFLTGAQFQIGPAGRGSKQGPDLQRNTASRERIF